MPSAFTVMTSWFCSLGGGAPVTSTFGGTSTSSPICRIGVATMKMMSSTSTTSTSGVMLISDRTPPEPPPPNDMLRFSFRDLLASLLVLGEDGDAAELRVVGRLHHRAHAAEGDPLVGLQHHVARRILVVLRLQVARQVTIRNPVLADEDR